MPNPQRSVLSARRHGVNGQVVVLPQPDLDAFQSFTAALVEAFSPADVHERQLAQCYANFQWRINRAAAIEDSMFALGLMEDVAGNLNLEGPEVHNAATYAKTFRQDSRAFDRLSMYLHRLLNGAAKVLKQLQQVQAGRREREQQELARAARLYQFHRMQNQAFEPAQHGFALSLPQIEAHIQCTILHKHAQLAESVDFDRRQYHQKVHQAAA